MLFHAKRILVAAFEIKALSSKSSQEKNLINTKIYNYRNYEKTPTKFLNFSIIVEFIPGWKRLLWLISLAKHYYIFNIYVKESLVPNIVLSKIQLLFSAISKHVYWHNVLYWKKISYFYPRA